MDSKRETLFEEIVSVAREMLSGPRARALIVLCMVMLVALIIYLDWDALNVD